MLPRRVVPVVDDMEAMMRRSGCPAPLTDEERATLNGGAPAKDAQGAALRCQDRAGVSKRHNTECRSLASTGHGEQVRARLSSTHRGPPTSASGTPRQSRRRVEA